MRRRFTAPLAALALALPTALLPADEATAAPADRERVLASWTQTDVSSYRAWYAARRNQTAWSAYGFDWSTDYCSNSPDNPLGFPFKHACARHDFGYRNYKALGAFPVHKPRLDRAFHADMSHVCATYTGSTRATCDSTAWTYYQAVVIFGRSPIVDDTSVVRT
ncbi:phospholipase [Streptomyces sp. NPDC006368]|uniref:phospholipase n=1 Tax=Streptomyces sp. NPDC006368 TaxID=3156760 RepID=UPI0033ADAACD